VCLPLGPQITSTASCCKIESAIAVSSRLRSPSGTQTLLLTFRCSSLDDHMASSTASRDA
jgi:hypothetical protein